MELHHYLLKIYDGLALRDYEIIVSLDGDAVEVLKDLIQKDNVRLREDDWLRKDPNWSKCSPTSGPFIGKQLVLQHKHAKFV